MTPTSLILNSLLKERWSISFKLYKRKKKTSYCKCTIYRITSKIKETLKIQKFDWLQTELGNPLEMKPCWCMVVCNSKSACVKQRIRLCLFQGPSQMGPWPEPQSGRAVVNSPFIPAPQFQWAHISRREQGPRSLNWSLGLAEIVGKTFLVTKFSFFFLFLFFFLQTVQMLRKTLSTKRMNKILFCFPTRKINQSSHTF